MLFTQFLKVWVTWTLVIVCSVDASERIDPLTSPSLIDLKSVDISKETIDSTTASDNVISCPPEDQSCGNDPFGFEAIQQLHTQIDDDRNGNVDREESTEFLRDDLKLEDGLTPRSDLHGNDDLISVHDLWKLWSNSEAYRWSVDDVIDWLTVHVELPQYAMNFRVNEVNGHMLPRLTSFSSNSLLSIIGVKNTVHRQKLALKAADVVLFGPPKSSHSLIKDLALGVSLLAAVFGCYFAYFQHRKSQSHLQKLMKDLKALQKAEDALSQLHLQLKKAQMEQQIVSNAKHDIEQQLKQEIDTAKTEAERLRVQRETLAQKQISSLKLAEDELIQLRKALTEAEHQLENRSSFLATDLQQWLQLTYEVETKYFEAKRAETEKQLKNAREMCDKLRKQKDKFFGSFHVAHSNSLDDTDEKILLVKRALDDVKKDLQERSFRWKEIESICGFNIIINPGIPYLNSLLHRSRFLACPSQPYQCVNKQGGFFPIDDLKDISFEYLPQSGSNLGPDLQKVMSLPGSANQQVLPNLMRAGMQLSLVGVNLTGMQPSRSFLRNLSPSPVSMPIRESESSNSLASFGSFGSLQLRGNYVTSGSQSWLSSLDSEAASNSVKITNSNGFLAESRDVTWSASQSETSIHDNGILQPSTTLPSPETETNENKKEQNKVHVDENSDQMASENSKQKSRRSKKKSPFSKLLKGSTDKEKTS